MKKKHTCKRIREIAFICFSLLLFLFVTNLSAQTNAPMRRPVSPQQPMYLIHIDTWNYPDPKKIIELIPADIRPYVVMNISLSISHDVTTSRFKVAEYGYEIAKSWLRVCAENQMWATVQPSSGGFCQFSDSDLSVYEEFFRDFPNFIGFNYAEQFWGYDDASDPLSAKWTDRMAHFANLLKVCDKYGGYLVVSWCTNQWGAAINPIAMLKRNPAFAAACRDYSKNYILCEKYTQESYISDMESTCLGAYLSGYSGQYGIRYDDTGWTDANGEHSNFTMATGLAAHLEHIMLTGQTVIDGPELIWTQCFKETAASATSDGFTRRNWATYPQFDNVSLDVFRKLIDGTVRIPTRKEVIDRTKVAIINDVNSGDNSETYSSPQTLSEGLYRMDGDGNYEYNKTFFKKTGRYPTIPTVYKLEDADANSFQLKINRSDYGSRWPDIASKTSELDQLFPQEYTGNLYAGRHENGWVTYNPYKTGETASACIPFKYNTCDSMKLTYSQYSAGVVKEFPDKITFYLNNYDNVLDTGLKNDTIRIYGCSSEPAYTSVDRGKAQASVISKGWEDGVLTLVVKHNGALDLTINCSGTATNRLTAFTPSSIIVPRKPDLYTGSRQNEFECADYKNISSVISGGYNGTVRKYTGQGYVILGTNANASLRDTVSVLKKGSYKLQIRYMVTSGDVNSLDLYVNDSKISTPTFVKTASSGEWGIYTQYVVLDEGYNKVMLKSNKAATYTMYLDNFVVSGDDAGRMYDFSSDEPAQSASVPAAQFVSVKSGSAGVVAYTDGNGQTSNCFKAYSAGSSNATGVADLELFSANASDYYVVWKEYYGTAGALKGILMRGTGSSSYAGGMKKGYLFTSQDNADNTVSLKSYIVGETGISEKTAFTTSLHVQAGQPCWYRARALGSQFVFECSSDSINWVGANTTTFTDSAYVSGATQLVWGLNSANYDWVMDNIASFTGNISASQFSLSGFTYVHNFGPSESKAVTVSGSSLTSNMLVAASANFEVSLDASSGYTSSITLPQSAGNIPASTLYVRLKTGLGINNYAGELLISSDGIFDRKIDLAGSVSPESVSKMYDFSNDVATTSATTPPALNTSIGTGNTATAGVVSYTDASDITSNVLKPYSGGNRNATGAIDLNLFSSKSTDYSVTWKQCVNAGKDYKAGVLLRGDPSKIGDDATGYVNGIMQGYLFIVYSKTSGGSEFRIYKSTSTFNALSMLVNTGVSGLIPSTNQAVWYRASVSGSSLVALKLEYSADSITWKTGSTVNDSSNPFALGSTQFVWGLGVANVDFYVDNITFYGIEDATLSGIEAPVDLYDGVTVIFSEYYTITGQRISNSKNNLKGFYIVKNVMSNGKVVTEKVYIR
jgi:hypothetical protein